MKAGVLFVLAAILVDAPAARAQTSPFVPDNTFHALANEISGERALGDLQRLLGDDRTPGSQGLLDAAEWVRSAAEAAGLADSKVVRQPFEGHSWACRTGEVWLLEPEERRLAAETNQTRLVAEQSRTTHVSAELVDVGSGLGQSSYLGKDVRGKIVLTDGPVGPVHAEAVWRRGALGVLSFPPWDGDGRRRESRRPQLPFEAEGVPGVADGTPATFALSISSARGVALRNMMARSPKAVRLRVDIEANEAQHAEQAIVEAWIRGTEPQEPQVVLTAHLQEEGGAPGGAAGSASLLEIGRALAHLVSSGKIPRPRRDIRLWWTSGSPSEAAYFRDNPQEARKLLLDMDLGALGEDATLLLTRSPWSIPSGVDDVLENVLAAVRDDRGLSEFEDRSLSIEAGSGELLRVRAVPYFPGTGHEVFLRSRVGVPATTLTLRPAPPASDPGGGPGSVEPPRLQRAALSVGAAALFFAGAGEEQAAILAGYVGAMGKARIGSDLATALSSVAGAGPAERDRAYRGARNLIHQAHVREALALAWVRRLAPKGARVADIISHATSDVDGGEGDDFSALERLYVALSGRNPPNPELTKEEKAMAQQVFAPVSDARAYWSGVGKVDRVEGLHPAVQFEILNFPDGKKSALDIFDAVAGEALAAGAWRVGVVSPAQVLETLERGAKAGALAAKTSR